MYEEVQFDLPDGPFVPTWDSLEHVGVPAWYQDAKFGIFIHWGPYSVPAFGTEWYPHYMYQQGRPEFEHHLKTYGPHTKFGYKDFIPLFTAPKFDADQWTELFARAGAKYVVPVAEHHDGFAMYDTKLSKWNAVQMGPEKDIVGLLAKATRDRGMAFGLSSHRAEHCWFMNGGRQFDSDVQDERYADFYGPAQPTGNAPPKEFKDDWLARSCELADKYQPSLVYFDTWVERPPLSPYLRAFAAYYYNRAAGWGKHVAINYKNHAFAPRAGIPDIERGQADDIQPFFWQSDTAVGKKSWSHVLDEEYKSAESIVCDLADIVAKNGTLLLNIGPHADGSIGEENEAILLEIGRWLKSNGEAIYGTRPWKVYGEGPTALPSGHFSDATRPTFTHEDFRFTTRGRKTLYAICLGRPKEQLLIRSLASSLRLDSKKVARVELLDGTPLTFRQQPDGLSITLPDAASRSYGTSIRMTRQ
jgi:alpha-L-fucosidase